MKNRSYGGFTLVELLVVVSIIAIISGMAIVLVGGATDKAAVTINMATQKQLADQVNSYIQLHNGLLPDKMDTFIRSDWSANGGAFSVLSSSVSVATDPAKFIGCAPSAPATGSSGSTAATSINRGVDPEAFSGPTRTLTVKQMTWGLNTSGTLFDYNNLVQIGVTYLYDYNPTAFSNGRLNSTVRTQLVAGLTATPGTFPICIIDPQSVAGQQLYADFGVDLSDNAVYAKDATTGELTDPARLLALQAQIFYVLGIGVNSTMIGDRQLGLQEPPASSIVTQGFYNRFGLVVKVGGLGAARSINFVGVLDPKGRGPTAARAAINGIR